MMQELMVCFRPDDEAGGDNADDLCVAQRPLPTTVRKKTPHCPLFGWLRAACSALFRPSDNASPFAFHGKRPSGGQRLAQPRVVQFVCYLSAARLPFLAAGKDFFRNYLSGVNSVELRRPGHLSKTSHTGLNRKLSEFLSGPAAIRVATLRRRDVS